MRIIILCQYFHPEIGAPSARLHCLGKDLIALGHEVVIATAFPNHPTGIIPAEFRGKLMSREIISGMTVLRSWVYATPNEGILRKTLSHLSFMTSSLILSGPRLGRADAIIVSSPAFFSVISAWLLSVMKGIPLIFEVRDLWPAIFVELGVLKNPILIRLLEALEMFLYRRSAAIVTVTDSFRDVLLRRGLPEDKVVTITNGVNLDDFSPGDATDLREFLGMKDKFLVLYIGAHGISHSLEAILRAAQALKPESDIQFLLVGEGARKSSLENLAKAEEIENVLFLPGQPRSEVLRFYRAADVCLVPLRNIPLFDTFIPSKIFEILGTGRPIVASVRGEAGRILSESGAAVVVEPEDYQGIARAIAELKSDPARRARMAKSGRDYVSGRYERRLLAQRYSDLLNKAARR